MSSFEKEADMSPIVSDWLRERGFTPYAELPISGSFVDFLGIDEQNRTVSVSMKLSLTKKVRYQAMRAMMRVRESWVAVATQPRESSLRGLIKLGVGCLSVKYGEPKIILEPDLESNLYAGPDSHNDLHTRKQLSQYEPGGEAGCPNQRGVGPAQTVYDNVQKYREEHPEATWKQIYEDVPNHYAHVKSMKGAMRWVGKNRKYKG